MAAKDSVKLLAAFETPPAFDLWTNPVVQQARMFESLAPAGGWSLSSDIFSHCNALNLCDDGWDLIDGGITKYRRLWLTYQFNSLTDYGGQYNYTTVLALLSVVTNPNLESELVFGFGWNRPETLSRLMFDAPDATLAKSVFCNDAWRSLHTVV